VGMSRYLADLRCKVGNQLLEMPSVSVILRDAEGRVLLVRQADGAVWSTPGGAVEPLECPSDAAVREMWEETGLHVRLTRLIGVFGGEEFVVEYSNGDKTSYAMIVFEAEQIGGRLRTKTEETTDAKYLSRDELSGGMAPWWLDEVLAAVDSPQVGGAFRPPKWAPPADA
jgi:ADP-ribose pyrophosphatase YjhB (NUDIX family)